MHRCLFRVSVKNEENHGTVVLQIGILLTSVPQIGSRVLLEIDSALDDEDELYLRFDVEEITYDIFNDMICISCSDKDFFTTESPAESNRLVSKLLDRGWTRFRKDDIRFAPPFVIAEEARDRIAARRVAEKQN